MQLVINHDGSLLRLQSAQTDLPTYAQMKEVEGVEKEAGEDGGRRLNLALATGDNCHWLQTVQACL